MIIYYFKHNFYIAISAAGLSGKNLFPMPYNDKFEAYSYKLIWSNGSGSDCIAILNAYNVNVRAISTYNR